MQVEEEANANVGKPPNPAGGVEETEPVAKQLRWKQFNGLHAAKAKGSLGSCGIRTEVGHDVAMNHWEEKEGWGNDLPSKSSVLMEAVGLN